MTAAANLPEITEADRLVNAFRLAWWKFNRYARHDNGCVNDPCTCGLVDGARVLTAVWHALQGQSLHGWKVGPEAITYLPAGIEYPALMHEPCDQGPLPAALTGAA